MNDESDGHREDDDPLVLRARSDREAFAELFDRYYPRVFGYCLRRLGNRGVAEDVTSDVFLSVATHLAGFLGRTESDFRRWLFRIATNAVRAHLRQSLRRQEIWNEAARSGQLSAGETQDDDPRDAPDWTTIATAIATLDERAQTIISLRFFAGLSHDEIASVVESTSGAVRTALSRALAQLRERLSCPGNELSRD